MKKLFSTMITFLFCAIICSGAGYKGTLPSVGPQFEYLKNAPAKTGSLYNALDENDKSPNYSKIPKDNPVYIDLILKKSRSTPYMDDMSDVITLLEKMQKCIDVNGNVQKFNAIASSIIDHADFLSEKYAEKPEEHYLTFRRIQELAAQARAVATLRCEAQVYVKYLAAQNNEAQLYSKDNINQQISYFSRSLDSTLQLLKDSN